MRGHVRKRGNKWSVVFYVGYDDAGKKKYKWFSGFDTKKAAERFLAEKAHDINLNGYVEPAKMRVSEMIVQWLEFKSTQVRPTTLNTYRIMMECYVDAHIGKVPLSKLTARHLQKLYADLLNSGTLKGSVIRVVHGLIHNMLALALKWDYVVKNVAEQALPPRAEKREMSIWTVEQAQRFLSYAKAKSKFYPVYVLAIATGLRKGELMGLKWPDIDFERSMLTVSRNLSLANKELIFTEPKTTSGRRSVVIPEYALEVLQRHRKHQLEQKLKLGNLYEDHNMVFARVKGQPLNPETVTGAWMRDVKRADVPYIRFHDMRHTHASLLLQQGVHPKVVSERLGHSNISITLDVYSHVMPGMQEQAATKFGDTLFGTGKKKTL